MSDVRKEFNAFLVSHPECFEVSKSTTLMRLLSFLEGRGRYFSELRKQFKDYKESSLKADLKELKDKGLIKSLPMHDEELYYLESLGRTLLSYYSRFKSSYSLM